MSLALSMSPRNAVSRLCPSNGCRIILETSPSRSTMIATSRDSSGCGFGYATVAGSFCPHIKPHNFLGQAVVCALYRHAGIRAVEIGSVMFGGDGQEPPHMEVVRLAVPRGVYTQSHTDDVIEAILVVFAQRDTLRSLEIVEAPSQLRHFTARFQELDS